MSNDIIPTAVTASPNRRAFLAVGSAVAICGALTSTAHAENSADAELIALGEKLNKCHQARELFEEEILSDAREAEFTALYDEHWALREKIEQIGASSLDGFKVKAKAVEYAFHYDRDAECTGSGSFLTLSHSLARDLLAL